MQKLEQIRNNIEHKYLHGQDLLNNLSTKAAREKNVDRTGMIREVASIPPLKFPSNRRANSVQPNAKNIKKHLRNLSLSLNTVDDGANSQNGSTFELTTPSYTSVKVGGARYKTPAP